MIPAASISACAAATSSTSKPATGPVVKCLWYLSSAPNTSTVSPFASRKTAKPGSSIAGVSPKTSFRNTTIPSNSAVRVPSQAKPCTFTEAS